MQRPNLVVGIVVDQMCYDYLTRFFSKYSNDGFKRLIDGGFNCENGHYNYIPTYTAIGHTSIYTGTTPSNHEIIGMINLKKSQFIALTMATLKVQELKKEVESHLVECYLQR